jgi:GNAT superfamily N-acetyltransferase
MKDDPEAPGLNLGRVLLTFSPGSLRLLPEAGLVDFRHSLEKGILEIRKAGPKEAGAAPWPPGCLGRLHWPALSSLADRLSGGAPGGARRFSLARAEEDRAVFLEIGRPDPGEAETCPAALEAGRPLAFRFAVAGDGPLVLDFIEKLAGHEKLLHTVKATVSLIDDWLFGRSGIEVVFALLGGREIGFALFFPNFSTFQGQAGLFIEDLFVLPEYRNLGAGKALIAELSALAIERGYDRLDWRCLEDNRLGREFYRSIGAKPLSEWLNYRLSSPELDRLAGLD